MLHTPIIEDTFFAREVLLKIFFFFFFFSLVREDYVHTLYHEILMIHRAMINVLWATLFAQNMINV